jgi:cytoskeleton protein RodZ
MRDIAKELHLDEIKVQALEDNRFDVLGAAVFTKGYLRKYAELVHVPIDDVLADYYRMHRATGAPPVVKPRQVKAVSPINPGRWIVGVILLALLAGAWWWWMNRPPAPVAAAATGSAVQSRVREQPDDAPDNAADVQREPSSSDAAGVTSSGPVREPATSVTQPVVLDAEPAPAPAVAEPTGLQVRLSFSGDCWTEVTDGSGRRLFFGLGTAGRIVTVSGSPPVRMLLGNNDNVSVQVNGVDYVVRPAQLRGNTARLTVGGQ